MEILAIFLIIIVIGFFIGFVGVLMDNELTIIGFSISIIMLIILLLFGCFPQPLYILYNKVIHLSTPFRKFLKKFL